MKVKTPLSSSYSSEKYFATLSGTELAAAVMDRVQAFYNNLPRTRNVQPLDQDVQQLLWTPW
jgi:hypothetical protein